METLAPGSLLTDEERTLNDVVLDLYNAGLCSAGVRDYWLKYITLSHVKAQIRERSRQWSWRMMGGTAR